MALFVLCLPCIAINLDKKDYRTIESNVHDISSDFMKYYAYEKQV